MSLITMFSGLTLLNFNHLITKSADNILIIFYLSYNPLIRVIIHSHALTSDKSSLIFDKYTKSRSFCFKHNLRQTTGSETQSSLYSAYLSVLVLYFYMVRKKGKQHVASMTEQ